MLKKIMAIVSSVAVASTLGTVSAFAEEESVLTDVETTEVVETNQETTATEEETTNTVEEYLLGDVNGDGKINSVDAAITLDDYAKWLANAWYEGVTEAEIDRANELYYHVEGDINGDGKENAKDTVYILKYYAHQLSDPDSDISLKDYYDGFGMTEYIDSEYTDKAVEEQRDELRAMGQYIPD